jgi:hypothetical protein
MSNREIVIDLLSKLPENGYSSTRYVKFIDKSGVLSE